MSTVPRRPRHDVVTHPLFGFAAYFVFIPVTHLSGLFNLMMEHEWVHHLEQIGFLVVGYLFFRVAFGLERGTTLHRGLRLVFVMAAVPVDTFTGLALAMSSHKPFPAYAAMAPRGSTTAGMLSNMHLGGAIMWIGGDALMLLALHPDRDRVGEVGDRAHARTRRDPRRPGDLAG